MTATAPAGMPLNHWNAFRTEHAEKTEHAEAVGALHLPTTHKPGTAVPFPYHRKQAQQCPALLREYVGRDNGLLDRIHHGGIPW
jgi:hypothetical protein